MSNGSIKQSRMALWVQLLLAFGLLVFATPSLVGAAELSDEERAKLQQGEAVVRTLEIEGNRRVEAFILIDAPVEEIWRVMLDCAAAPEFVPNMRRCEVFDTAEDESWQIIEHEVKYGWIAPRTVYRFRAEYEAGRHIHFERISGDLRHLKGDWRLQPASQEGASILVSYSVFIDPGILVPGFMVRRALRRDVPDVLHALRERVEHVAQDQNVEP